MDAEDKERLRAVIEHKLDGVMFHTANFERFARAGLPGFAAMHRWQALDEHNEYMHLVETYIHTFGEFPEVKPKDAPVEAIPEGMGTFQKMEHGITTYEEYERGVLSGLRSVRDSSGEQLHKVISELIEDVRKEIEFVDEIEKYVDKCSENEKSLKRIDETLHEKFKSKLKSM
jgi:ferritin